MVHCDSLQAWWKATPIFYTATDTVAVFVNVKYVVDKQQDAMLPY